MFNRDGEQATGSPFNSWSPRWKDRIFGDNKSRDEVIQQLRDELDRQRKMFFERTANPEWTSTDHRGFPFSDTARRFADRAGFPHFEDSDPWIEDGGRQRNPSGGSCRTTSSKSSSGSNSSGSEADRSEAPFSNSPKIRRAATRSATGQFPTLATASASPRGFRASSAPPPPTSSSPRRFTSTLKVPMNEPAEPKQQQPPQSQQQQHPQQHTVRQIPIFVEGRDEPVLAKLEEEERTLDTDPDTLDGNQRVEQHDHSKPIPMPYHPQNNQADESSASKPIPLPYHSSAPANPEPQPAANDDSHKPIPLPFRQETVVGSSAAQRDQHQADPEKEARITLSQIDCIRREAECLMPRIEAFKGQRNDREFLFLDEMLTRLLLKLDLVSIEGREDLRQARKEAIGSIQRCINLLESKCFNANQESDSGISQMSKDNSDTSEASCSEPIAVGYSHI